MAKTEAAITTCSTQFGVACSLVDFVQLLVLCLQAAVSEHLPGPRCTFTLHRNMTWSIICRSVQYACYPLYSRYINHLLQLSVALFNILSCHLWFVSNVQGCIKILMSALFIILWDIPLSFIPRMEACQWHDGSSETIILHISLFSVFLYLQKLFSSSLCFLLMFFVVVCF